jgi:hypothetical protein
VKVINENRSELTKEKVSGFNRNIVGFSFFLFISFILWYLNSLGKEIEAEISVPVKLVNIPKERSVIAEPSLKLNLFIKGPGYSVLKLKVMGEKSPLIIDILKVNCVKIDGSDDLDYFILTSGLTRSLSVQLRSECEITSIKPDTLFFSMGKVALRSNAMEPGNANGKNGKKLSSD